MHNPPHHPHYHGWAPLAYPQQQQGFCHGCGHPSSRCLCGHRECRKEARELLVPAERAVATIDTESIPSIIREKAMYEAGKPEAPKEDVEKASMAAPQALLENIVVNRQAATGRAFIGGGCCVHLSIEYASVSESSQVHVIVEDTEGTMLSWGKKGIQPGYYIKEGIITTNPGARLMVVVQDVIARVRWCEVFSC